MNPQDIKAWIGVIQGLLTMSATLVGGLWAWSKFVLERGLMPPSQMEISMRKLGTSISGILVEFSVDIRNKGSSALVVSDLRIRLRYLKRDDELKTIDDSSKRAFGRVNFLHAHVIESNQSGGSKSGEFVLIPYDTFVQPDVDQSYTFATVLPATSEYVWARASFHYELRASKMQKRILKLSRKLGMLQYSLDHVSEPHTVEKSFSLRDEASQQTQLQPCDSD